MPQKPQCPLCFSDDITFKTMDEAYCNYCKFQIMPDNEPIEYITPSEAKQEKNVILLDIRQPNEHKIASIKEAVFIPQQELPNKLEQLNKNKDIICFCHHGGRSHLVARYLIQKGFKAKNMQGGIHCWSVEVDTNVLTY